MRPFVCYKISYYLKIHCRPPWKPADPQSWFYALGLVVVRVAKKPSEGLSRLRLLTIIINTARAVPAGPVGAAMFGAGVLIL